MPLTCLRVTKLKHDKIATHKDNATLDKPKLVYNDYTIRDAPLEEQVYVESKKLKSALEWVGYH